MPKHYILLKADPKSMLRNFKNIFKNQYIKVRYLLTPACDNPFNLFNNCNVLSLYKMKMTPTGCLVETLLKPIPWR